MGRKLICYRCFEKFKAHDVWFRCQNRRELGSTNSCELEEDSKTHEMDHHAFKIRNFIDAFLALFRMPRKCRCPLCKEISTKRLCPYCHHPILWEAGEIDEHIIAIIGGPGAGKSHYLTVLIEHCLKGHVGRKFNAHIAKADDDTAQLFRQKYRGPLINDKTEIPPNRPEDRADDRLLFRLNFSKKHPLHPLIKKTVNKPITLVFFDIAGELLNQQEVITDATRYLWQSSGIIYLVNPIHLPEIAKLITNEAEIPEVTPDDMLFNVSKEIKKNKVIKAASKVKIPIAVCLSQSDRMRDNNETLFMDERVFEAHQHNGKFDANDMNVCDAEIRDKLTDWSGTSGSLRQMVEDHFERNAFFATSALGSSPVSGHIEEIQPIRLEDPFLWVLSEIGVISKAKG